MRNFLSENCDEFQCCSSDKCQYSLLFVLMEALNSNQVVMAWSFPREFLIKVVDIGSPLAILVANVVHLTALELPSVHKDQDMLIIYDQLLCQHNYTEIQ